MEHEGSTVYVIFAGISKIDKSFSRTIIGIFSPQIDFKIHQFSLPFWMLFRSYRYCIFDRPPPNKICYPR